MFNSTTTTVKPLLLAHRGSRLLAPENTSVAFDLALAHGSDVLEIDVRLTKDLEIIVTHDVNVDRTSDGSGNVRDHTLSEIKRFDAGYRFIDLNGKHYRGSGIRFETLQDMLTLYPTTRFNIDIKDNDVIAARILADLLLKHDCASRVNVGSFHSPIMTEFRLRAPLVSTAATQAEVARLFALSCLRSNKALSDIDYQVLQIPRVLDDQ
jgi:glycerophosphoryl diester phosphodiesterase